MREDPIVMEPFLLKLISEALETRFRAEIPDTAAHCFDIVIHNLARLPYAEIVIAVGTGGTAVRIYVVLEARNNHFRIAGMHRNRIWISGDSIEKEENLRNFPFSEEGERRLIVRVKELLG